MLSSNGSSLARQAEVNRTTEILVVDDDDLIRTLLAEVLREEGYSITTAVNGRAAVELMHSITFDLMVTDIVMPEMDGVELIRASQRFASDVPIVVITGYPSTEGVSQLVSMGVIDYIIKPFDAQQIKVTVAKVLEMQRVANLKARFQAVHQVAAIDPLTGVYNGTAFGHILDAELERSKWRNRICSLMLASVDDLAALRIEAAVKALERSLEAVSMFKGPGDTVGRINESELGVVLAEVGSEGAIGFARRVMGRNDEFTLSVGVASFPEHAANAEDLAALARSALAASVSRGGNRVSAPQQRLEASSA